MGELIEQGKSMTNEGERVRVKVDGEDAILHITDQSVMFEKGGNGS